MGELAEEYDALACETAGKEDEDGAGRERVAVLGGVCGLASLYCAVRSMFYAPTHFDFAIFGRRISFHQLTRTFFNCCSSSAA